METDGPLLDDVNMLKKAVDEKATQVSVCNIFNMHACICGVQAQACAQALMNIALIIDLFTFQMLEQSSEP